MTVVALGLAMSWSPAIAKSEYWTEFLTTYPTSRSGTNSTCFICHSEQGGGWPINGYGNAWSKVYNAALAQGQPRTTATRVAAYRAIEAQNSDTDPGGATNLAEITAHTQPGWKLGAANTSYDSTVPDRLLASNLTAPTDFIMGDLDPAAPANQPPVLALIGNKTGTEGQLLRFTVTATDPNSNAITLTGTNLPTGATLTDNRDGTATFAWTPGFTQSGNFPVTVTATDNGTPAQSDSETFTITVGNVNRPPVLGTLGNRMVNQGQLLQFTVTATDPDGDELGFEGVNLPTGATLLPAGPGSATFSWTPSPTQSGNFPVTVIVTDGGTPAQNAQGQFTITVGNVNQPPTLGALGNRMATEGQLLEFTVTATDPERSPLIFSGANLPSGATLTDNRDGSATFAWTPAPGQSGNYPGVTVTVTDGGTPPQSASGQFTITVGNVNRPPVLGAIGARTLNEGDIFGFTVNATDPDGNMGALRFTTGTLPRGATFNDNRDGTADFLWTPGFDQAGNYEVTVTVTDAGGLTAAETFTISVGNVNRPPVLDPIGNRTGTIGQPLMIMLGARDPDGDALTFTATNLPTGATLTDNRNGTATLAWTPMMGYTGGTITVNVADGGMPTQRDSETFNIMMGMAEPPPTNPLGLTVVKFQVTRDIKLRSGDQNERLIRIRLRVRQKKVKPMANAPLVTTNSTQQMFSQVRVVGTQNGATIYDRPTGQAVEEPITMLSTSVTMAEDRHSKYIILMFDTYKPTAAGDITWKVTIPGGELATAVTYVRMK
jgi:hypothetical protein